MQPWRLRDRITIEKPVEVQDETTGEIEITWETVTVLGVDSEEISLANIPAEVLTGDGNQNFSAGAEQNGLIARINIRWVNLDKLEILNYRVLWDGQYYEIVSAITDRTNRREWRLMCKGGKLFV